MPAYRCETCDINFPPTQKKPLEGCCKKCGRILTYYTNLDFHTDWDARSAKDAKQVEAESERWGPHPADDGCPVIYNNNTDTIHVQDRDLRAVGYLPESGDIVKLNGKFYELLGFSLRGRMWWIEPFNFQQTSEEIFALPTETGPSSDDIIALDHEGKTIYWDPKKDPFRELMEESGDPET